MTKLLVQHIFFMHNEKNLKHLISSKLYKNLLIGVKLYADYNLMKKNNDKFIIKSKPQLSDVSQKQFLPVEYLILYIHVKFLVKSYQS